MCILVLACTGCDFSTDWGPEQLGRGKTSQPLRQLELGRASYATYCAGCHGDNGDGKGPAARFLDPRPRDFRVGKIKFAAVEAGSGPNDDDYLRIITTGLAGTAMPAFPLLPGQEREALVAYIKTFRKDRLPPGTRIALPRDPFESDPARGAAEGAKVYHQFVKCQSCHPTYAMNDDLAKWTGAQPVLRANPYESETKDSEWGAPIRPPDFLTDRLKTGSSVESLARVISSGVGGTAMPTWSGLLKPEQIWGLAYYVRELALERGTATADLRRMKLRAQPALPPPPRSKDEED